VLSTNLRTDQPLWSSCLLGCFNFTLTCLYFQPRMHDIVDALRPPLICHKFSNNIDENIRILQSTDSAVRSNPTNPPVRLQGQGSVDDSSRPKFGG
jgi:hypothetical protein